MKPCTKCLASKDPADFHVRRASKDGLALICKQCAHDAYKLHYAANQQAIYARTKAYAKSRPEQTRGYALKHAATPQAKARNCFATRLRETSKENATPAWLTPEQLDHIKAHYETAQIINSEIGTKLEVDHIVPLQGKNVCGLHVPWNLQLLDSKANRVKGNRHET